jgi:3-oxoacyl-(acyl-carrier-protein) synthase
VRRYREKHKRHVTLCNAIVTPCNAQCNGKIDKDKDKDKDKEDKNKESLFDIPEVLNTPKFLQAWESWQAHRKEIRKPLTKQSVKMQMKTFAEWGVDRAVAAIEHTISKGWQGIREQDKQGEYANGIGTNRLQHRIEKANREYQEENLHAPVITT